MTFHVHFPLLNFLKKVFLILRLRWAGNFISNCPCFWALLLRIFLHFNQHLITYLLLLWCLLLWISSYLWSHLRFGCKLTNSATSLSLWGLVCVNSHMMIFTSFILSLHVRIVPKAGTLFNLINISKCKRSYKAGINRRTSKLTSKMKDPSRISIPSNDSLTWPGSSNVWEVK